MPPQPIAIFGAGGQGREVLQLLRQINAPTPQWAGLITRDEILLS